MDETNPYAAPMAETTLAASESWQGLWRDKRDLVMHKDAKLPNVCVKTGVQTTHAGVVRKLSWHSPWLALAILINLIVFVILALVLSKRATIEIPLSDEARARRKSNLMFCWLAGLASLAAMFGCIFLLVNSQDVHPVFVGGIFVGLISMIVAVMIGQGVSRILRPTRITKTHIWLRGVHSNILDDLPPVPPFD